MKRRFQIVVILLIVIFLMTLLVIQVQIKNKYETYLRQENENSISTILSVIQSNNEILKNYEETGKITYAELSRLGSDCFYAEKELIALQRQTVHFVSKEKYSNENINTMIRYFDGVSLFVSMDMLQGIGNYYPHMYKDDIYELNQDEKLLDYMLELNLKFIDIIAEKGFINNRSNDKEYYINIHTNNGLTTFIDLVDGLANETKNYLQELSSHDKSKLVEEFLLEVNYQ